MYSWDNAQVVLVGNKCDLEQDRAVTQERGKRLADQLGKFCRYCNLTAYSIYLYTHLLLFICFYFGFLLLKYMLCCVLCI